jgi:hypothetical protein
MHNEEESPTEAEADYLLEIYHGSGRTHETCVTDAQYWHLSSEGALPAVTIQHSMLTDEEGMPLDRAPVTAVWSRVTGRRVSRLAKQAWG